MAYPENALTLDILPLSADTAGWCGCTAQSRVSRCPRTASTGGRQLCCYRTGRLLLFRKAAQPAAADKTCRYEAAPDGTARLTRAFGQTVGGTCRRYDFDFDAPASDADTLHPVCGNFLEEIALPDSLQVIGSCAFYNCRSLRLLTVGSSSLTVGSDVFLNCFALETIRVQAAPGTPPVCLLL